MPSAMRVLANAHGATPPVALDSATAGAWAPPCRPVGGAGGAGVAGGVLLIGGAAEGARPLWSGSRFTLAPLFTLK
jgi:hypothetical protein